MPTLQELEAEAAELRREGEGLPKGDAEALHAHLERLRDLAQKMTDHFDRSARPSSS